MDIYHELKVIGEKDLLKKFYEDNKVTKEDMKINPLLYPNETRLSFEKTISTASVHKMYKKYINHQYDFDYEKSDIFEIKNKNVKKEDFIKFLWGTVSNAQGVEVTKESNYYLYSFFTKDYSPIVWFYAISKKYMNLTFEVSIFHEKSQTKKDLLHFERGDVMITKNINMIEQFYQKHQGVNAVFQKIIDHMNEKKIDSMKYMKRIYEKHYKGAEGNVENVDFEGVLEDFIEKVKLDDYINTLFEEDESLFYYYSKEFVEYILYPKK